MEYLFLIGGFILLIVGADVFVEGSSNIAKILKIPSIIIGLTIVALGTSLPEAAVSISASLAGENSLAVSNVVGSNIFNTLVVLGASAVIFPVKSNKSAVKKEIPFSMLMAIVLLGTLVFGITKVTGSDLVATVVDSSYTVTRVGGIILLAGLAFYMYWQISSALKARKNGELVEEDDDDSPKMSIFMSAELIIVGAVGIVMGGDLVVENATIIAENFGMSSTFIGLTIVALGTSLPELVTSMVAARKGESDLALGNVIGSNIFNIVFILGSSAVISPMTVAIETLIDILILIAISVVVWIFSKTKYKVSRLEGGAMLLMYVAYFVYILLRTLAQVA